LAHFSQKIVGSFQSEDCWLISQSVQTKVYKICICCFSTKHAALRSKTKDWLAKSLENVSMWSNILLTDCCFSELLL
jgi:hypothetical protein